MLPYLRGHRPLLGPLRPSNQLHRLFQRLHPLQEPVDTMPAPITEAASPQVALVASQDSNHDP